MTNALNFPKTVLLCLAAEALNFACVLVFRDALGVPLFADTVGTVAATFCAGLVPGLAVAITTVLSGKTYIEPQIASELVTYERSLSVFTRRETDILRLVIQGKSNAEIARTLGIQKRAVENYVSRIYDKTGCWNRAELVERFGKVENNEERPPEQSL